MFHSGPPMLIETMDREKPYIKHYTMPHLFSLYLFLLIAVEALIFLLNTGMLHADREPACKKEFRHAGTFLLPVIILDLTL